MIIKTRVAPKEGDIKIEKHFAFFPTWVNDNKIWLQSYSKHFKYTYRWRWLPLTGGKLECFGWDLIKESL